MRPAVLASSFFLGCAACVRAGPCSTPIPLPVYWALAGTAEHVQEVRVGDLAHDVREASALRDRIEADLPQTRDRIDVPSGESMWVHGRESAAAVEAWLAGERARRSGRGASEPAPGAQRAR